MAILPPATTTGDTGRDGGLIFDSVVGVDLNRIADLPVSVLDGRLPDPTSTDEVAVTLDYLNRVGVDEDQRPNSGGYRTHVGLAPRVPVRP